MEQSEQCESFRANKDCEVMDTDIQIMLLHVFLRLKVSPSSLQQPKTSLNRIGKHMESVDRLSW